MRTMTMGEVPKIRWPAERAFAFTVFDDPDAQTTADGKLVYDFLKDLGFRTTKGVWPIQSPLPKSCKGLSLDDEEYRQWCESLHRDGFEMGFHNAGQRTSPREETLRALVRFEEVFGAAPRTMSNHYNSGEGIYWGDKRLGGLRRVLYNLVTRGVNRNKFFGEIEGHPLYWGDLCRDRMVYIRNFVFREINTLRSCPLMPYHDPERPLVKRWYASSEGANRRLFVDMISEENQDRLESEGGACIMYTHFGHGYVTDGKLDPKFRDLMIRLSRKNGWYAPVGTVLDWIESTRPTVSITAAQRRSLEWHWLRSKLLHGTS